MQTRIFTFECLEFHKDQRAEQRSDGEILLNHRVFNAVSGPEEAQTPTFAF